MGTLGTKKIQSAPIWTKFAGLVGGIKKISWEVILKCSCTLLRSEGSKVEDFGEKKPPKVEDWKSILNEILTFEKKTTKSGGFSSFDKKSKKKTPKDKGFSSFQHQKWRIWFQNLNKILHFWCFFFHFEKRDKKRLKILVIVEVQEVTAKSRQTWEFGRDRK